MANNSIYAAFERMWQHVVANLGNKAELEHEHDDLKDAISNITSGMATVAKATKASQDESGNVITDTYETKTNAEAKLAEAKEYTDQIKSEIYGGVPKETLDTLTELATAFEENAEVVEALDTAITNKADKEHSHTISDVTGLQTALDEIDAKTTMVVTLNEVSTFAGNAEPTFTIDKTFEEISNHINNGGNVVLYDSLTANNNFKLCTYVENEVIVFSSISVSSTDFTIYAGETQPFGVIETIVQILPDNSVTVGSLNCDLQNSEIYNLNTTNKTVIGAINEVNDKASTMIVTLLRKTESQSERGAASGYEVDKSFDEIMAHINNGGTVLLYDGIGIIGNIYMNLMFVEQEIGILMFNTLMVNSTDSSVLADIVNPIGVEQYTVLIQQGVVLVQKTVVDLNSTEISTLDTDDKTIIGAINEVNDKASVQPDWNQNDEAANDYIKNRPFGEFEEVVLPETVIDGFNTDATDGILSADLDTAYVKAYNGNTFNVLFDGEIYNVTCVEQGYIGNSHLRNDNKEDSGEPFLFYFARYEQKIYTNRSGDSHTVSIIKNVVDPIDEKFIPNTIARVSELTQADWNQNDETAVDYIKNRTHYDSRRTGKVVIEWDGNLDGKEVVDPNASTSTDYNIKFVKLSNDIPTESALLSLQDSSYISYIKTFSSDGSSDDYKVNIREDVEGVYIGSDITIATVDFSFTDTFTLTKGIWAMYTYNDADSIYVSRIEYDDTYGELKLLDEKYLPDSVKARSDWNENNTDSASYIDNRTHYDSRRIENFIVEWDGNLDGKEVVDPNATTYASAQPRFVKICDEIPNETSMKNNPSIEYVVTTIDSGTTTSETLGVNIITTMDGFYPCGDKIIIIPDEFSPSDTITLSRGIWTAYENDDEFGTYTNYVSKIKYEEMVGELKPLDAKYLENSVGRHTEGQTVYYNGVNYVSGQCTETFNDYINNKATGEYSHAEGHVTYALGSYSHSEGHYTEAVGDYSHSEGTGTVASGEGQHVQGKYNIDDTENKYAHIIGNGTHNTERSNAHTLDWSGNAWYAGHVESTAIILKSPNGTRFSITVGDDGVLTASEITE